MNQTNQQLQEQYEDAVFALLMDEYAKLEGDRLLAASKAARDNPAFQVPEGAEERGLKKIRKAYRRHQIRQTLKSFQKPVARVAVVFLVICALFSVSFVTIEAVRVKVINTIMEVSDTHTHLVMGDQPLDGMVGRYSLNDFMKVMPESFSLTSYQKMEFYATAVFDGPDGERVIWGETPIGASSNIDTEDAERIDSVVIDNYDGILVVKDGFTSVYWSDQTEGLSYSCEATLPEDKIISMIHELIENTK